MKLWCYLREALKRYVIQLEKSNQEVFGNQKPDCCSLNRQKGRNLGYKNVKEKTYK